MSSVLVVLPVRNESSTAVRTAEEVCSFSRSHANYRFLVVDDASSDETADLFDRAFENESSASVLRLTHNRGKGGAVEAGFAGAKEDFLIFTDGDMAYPFSLLPNLVEALEENDVVIGSRGNARGDNNGINKRRVFLGQGFNRLVCLLMGFNHPDTQAGIKGFRKEAAQFLFKHSIIRSFCFDVELLYLAKKAGLRVREIPVQTSSVHNYTRSKVRLMLDSLKMFGDLLRILWRDGRGGYG